MLRLVLLFLFLVSANLVFSQTEPIAAPLQAPAKWKLRDSSAGTIRWKNPDYFLPDANDQPLSINVNFIIVQKADGTGNFQDNKEDRWFLEYLVQVVNEVYYSLKNRNEEYYPGKSLPFLSDAKIRIVPHYFFVRDETGWNNRNDKNFAGVPYLSGWYLDSLDSVFYHNPLLTKAINLFFTTDGALYEEMVIRQTTTAYNEKVFFKQHAASEVPAVMPIPADKDVSDKYHSMRAHIANVWLKLWWKRNVLKEPDWSMAYEVGKSIAHELGHLFGLEHTPDSQKDALMRTRFGGLRDYLSTAEIARIHQAFALNPTLWQFADPATQYLNGEKRVDRLENWDAYIRLYSPLALAEGDTLRLSGELQMPEGSRIDIAPGAVLEIDGGVLCVASGPSGELQAPGLEIILHSEEGFSAPPRPSGQIWVKGKGRVGERVKWPNVKN